MKKDFVFTSESVTEGHPDKLCDQVSDAIIDHFLELDPYSRVRAECAVATSILFIAARFASEAKADIAYLARKAIRKIGYQDADFDARKCSILTSLQEYPPDVDIYFNEKKLSSEEIDRIHVRQNANLFGFACNQTPDLMPLPVWTAHRLARRIDQVRRENLIPYLSPDAKTQVGVEYRDRQPYRLHNITIIASSTKASCGTIPASRVHDDIMDAVIKPVFADEEMRPDKGTKMFINPVEHLLVGGPAVHSGLTGRKSDVDTYGEYGRHGSSALSGKDPLRIDRIGAYAARYAAKNMVAAGLASTCEVWLCYTIGLARPVSIQVDSFGTGTRSDEELTALVKKHFDFRLAGILNAFDCRNLPALNKGKFYRLLSVYGHMGRSDLDLPWEATDRVEALKSE
jgi:S-adenosylmethionine synthetase